MIDFTTLPAFSVAVLLLLLSPGPNMAFVMAHAVRFGFNGGAAAALGIGAADLLLTMLTATGITAMVAVWPPAFDIIRYAGAAYLLWMASQALRHLPDLDGWDQSVQSVQSAPSASPRAALKSVFVRAMVNSVLNPKALLFFMVFLPQFIDRNNEAVALQLIVLGVVLAAISTVFHTLLGTCGSAANRFLLRHPAAAVLHAYALTTVLLLLALRLLAMQRPL